MQYSMRLNSLGQIDSQFYRNRALSLRSQTLGQDLAALVTFVKGLLIAEKKVSSNIQLPEYTKKPANDLYYNAGRYAPVSLHSSMHRYFD